MTTEKRLQRSLDDRWIGGVCGGLADYTGLDARLIRLTVAVATVLGFGSLIVAYVVAWIIMPNEDPRPAGTTAPAPAPPSE
jgi:phage shock protein PspC (stress-responsive transcriptional regulator)